MSLTKEEKIIRLRRGIASSETSDALRSIMQADLDELLKPEPVYVAPVVKEKPKPVKKAVKAKKEEPKAPEPKAPELTEERKKAMMDEYAREKARKKAKQEEEN